MSGVKKKQRFVTEEIRKEFKRLKKQKLTISEIGKKTGFSYYTVKDHLHQMRHNKPLKKTRKPKVEKQSRKLIKKGEMCIGCGVLFIRDNGYVAVCSHCKNHGGRDSIFHNDLSSYPVSEYEDMPHWMAVDIVEQQTGRKVRYG
jgi:hypothetical protein